MVEPNPNLSGATTAPPTHSRVSVVARLFGDASLAGDWALSYEWAGKWFGGDFLERLAKQYQDASRRTARAAAVGVLVSGVLVIYTSGAQFDIKLAGVDIRTLPAMVEILTLAAAMNGFGFANAFSQAVCYQAVMRRYIKAQPILFFTNLLEFSYFPHGLSHYAEPGAVSYWQLPKRSWVITIVLGAPAIIFIICIGIFYYYAQTLGLWYIVHDASTPRVVRYGSAGLILLANVGSLMISMSYLIRQNTSSVAGEHAKLVARQLDEKLSELDPTKKSPQS